MPSVSAAQHRFIGYLHSNPEARAHSGMSQAKVDEWLHADRGSPWKHRASGGPAKRNTEFHGDWTDWLARARPLRETGDPGIYAFPQSGIDKRMEGVYTPDVYQGSDADQGMRGAAYGGIVQRRDAGGMVDPTSSPIGGIAPSAQTMNPQTQALVQRYSALPTEKLYELSAQLGATPEGQIVRKLLQQKQAMPQQGMQPAQQSGGMQQPQGYAGGGAPAISPSMQSPWWTRHEAETSAKPATGFLNGATAGRADSLKTQAPSGSYVLPADVVAGLGEGNSLAGARVVQDMLSTGPHGIPMPRGGGRNTIPRPPALGDLRQFAAKGGDIGGDDTTPVALSHGEYVVTPQDVSSLGGGDLKRGHRILDAFVLHVRKKHIAKLKSLPGPVGAKKKSA